MTFEQKSKGKEGTDYTYMSGKPGYIYDSGFAFVGHFASNIRSSSLCLWSLANGNQFQYPYWKISWTEEPGGLQSMGSQRVGTTGWLTLTAYSNDLICPCKFPILSFSWLACCYHLGELSVTSPSGKTHLPLSWPLPQCVNLWCIVCYPTAYLLSSLTALFTACS